MSKKMIFGLILGLLLGFQSHAADIFGKELACYRDLISYAWGANYNLQGDIVLIPGTKGSKRGFYTYTDQMAYFCEFPRRPAESSSSFEYYYFELKITGKKPVYMTYSDQKSKGTNPDLMTSTSPVKANKGKYVVPRCREYLTDESRGVLASELKARISTVKSAFDNQKKDMLKRYRKTEKPDKYKDALEVCKAVGGDVRKLANTEFAKFPSTSPTNDAGQGQPSKAAR